MRAAMRAFKALQVTADARYQNQRQPYEEHLEECKLRKAAKRKTAVRALEKDAGAGIDLGDITAPDPPVARTYWTSDATRRKAWRAIGGEPEWPVGGTR
jgi:hypothetical protein